MVRTIWEKGMKCREVPIFNDDLANDKTFAAFYGRLRALFGNPNSNSASFEDMYHYDIKVTADDGRVLYIGIKHSGIPVMILPADGSGNDTRPYKAARTELIMRIMCTHPADYEWCGISDELSLKITYKVKDGRASFKKEPAEDAI